MNYFEFWINLYIQKENQYLNNDNNNEYKR